jgi:hypothetical protein
MVAELYREAETMGVPPSTWVGQRMAEMSGLFQQDVKPSTARRWAMIARDRGLLPPTPIHTDIPQSSTRARRKRA